MMRVGAGLCALACAGLAVPVATAGRGGPSIVGTEIVDGPARVRVVVSVSGPAAAAREGAIEAFDADPSDGRAVIDVARAKIAGPGTAAGAAGVRVTPERRSTGVRLRLLTARGAFKFVSYRASRSGDRLFIDLWKGTGARRGQQVLDDGCLRLTGWSGGRGRAGAGGLELRPLFEHSVVLSLRDAAGRRLALRPLTATPGRFLPGFSGYRTPGRWRGALRFTVAAPRRALLEAWSASARDGSLECLVQVPVRLFPSTGG